MNRAKGKARALGLKPLVTIRSFGNAGGDPQLMLLAPIPAAERALARARAWTTWM